MDCAKRPKREKINPVKKLLTYILLWYVRPVDREQIKEKGEKMDKAKYSKAYEDAQAGGMNETESHEFAVDQATRSKAQFTPGPWTVNSCGYVGTAPKTDNDTGWTLIACPAELHGPTSYVRLPDAKEQACNARLIATAPDYHRIIEALADWLDEGDNLPRPESLMPGSESETFAQAIRAAYAKAKGE